MFAWLVGKSRRHRDFVFQGELISSKDPTNLKIDVTLRALCQDLYYRFVFLLHSAM